ncbi:DUF4389 domain-containing protein [Streptomyces sp. BHT-5-2]|uniref:DUF4389 domain-containing protein n=1 Tax=unclassified Streptomyces TaxID=2593676 RepID=UPI001C8ED3DD|nr:DUF4389 domain-containing protein [Streptomyces sp. BHT-5-2]QZL05307.1 DUF4389 domain-containing protein [Streptomyces sp. BHT-5-2]
MATIAEEYRPVRVEAELDEPLSRWLWTVKWLLLVPHHLLLTPLFIAFLLATALAFPVIFFTGRYPRPLFRFARGVLRWFWRVVFYSYGALATDRYPPFTLGLVPDYPARLYIDRPEHLPRGPGLLVSRLRALPQWVGLVLVGLLFRLMWWIGGLSAVLALAVLVVLVVSSPAAVLLWKGRYPRHRFTGMVAFDRWAVQLLAYTFFLTDACPPLRPESAGRSAGGLRARLRGGLRHRPPRGPTPAVSAR